MWLLKNTRALRRGQLGRHYCKQKEQRDSALVARVQKVRNYQENLDYNPALMYAIQSGSLIVQTYSRVIV